MMYFYFLVNGDDLEMTSCKIFVPTLPDSHKANFSSMFLRCSSFLFAVSILLPNLTAKRTPFAKTIIPGTDLDFQDDQ